MKTTRFFDAAATTKCCDAAIQRLIHFSGESYGNPSSAHELGRSAARAVSDARKYFGEVFSVHPDQVVFTGSGSEANNLAILGAAYAYLSQHGSPRTNPPNLVTSEAEHPSVRKPVESTSDLGMIPRVLKTDSSARVPADALENAIDPHTLLVSLMRVNNIVGSIHEVEDLARRAKAINPSVIFHTDGIQAFGKIDLPRGEGPVDLVSISAHKIHGPKGIGALIFLNRKLMDLKKIRPLVWGGGQESGFRSGTQNPGLIAAFQAAAEMSFAQQDTLMKRTHSLRLRFIQLLRESNLLADSDSSSRPIHINSPEDSAPYILNLSVPGVPAGPFSRMLESCGCLVSTGSACSTGKAEPDPVLSSMGLPEPLIDSALRISLSDCNTEADVEDLASAFISCLKKISKVSERTL